MSELKERENLIVPYRVIDISTIKVPRYDGKQLSYGQYSDLPKNTFFLHTSGGPWCANDKQDLVTNKEKEFGKIFPWIESVRTLKSGKKKRQRISINIHGKSGYACCKLQTDKYIDYAGGKRKYELFETIHSLLGKALFPEYFVKHKEWVVNHKKEGHNYLLQDLSIIRYQHNYLTKNIKSQQKALQRDIIERQGFSTGGFVGG
tara:strand:+ start:698 stop:1309 length:612 start_codon:yes stop_codon:yes gene_type:complete